MFVTVTIAILLISGVALLLAAARMSGKNTSTPPLAVGVGGGIALLVAVAVTGMSTFTVIGATEVGVPVSFGKVGEPLTSGRHFTAPWVSVETYPTRPVTVELSEDQKIIARTEDAGQMQVEVATRWKVDPADATALYLQVRTGDDDRISRDVVEKNLRQAVGEVYSKIGNLDAVNDRTKVTSDIKATLQEALHPYGITVEDVNLRSVEPDERTAATIAAFAQQQQATRIAEEAKKTAIIEAQRRLIEAEGLKKSARAAAGITNSEAKVLCLQAWTQMLNKAIEAGEPIYVSPCGDTGQSVIVDGG